MKHITRLALAFAVAAIACLSPMAHADDEASLVGSGIKPERYYTYSDEDGMGMMVVKDGPKYEWRYEWRRRIYVTISQNGHTYSGQGWRALTSGAEDWFAYCEFWVSGGGVKAKFNGRIQIKDTLEADPGGGHYVYYAVSGLVPPHKWECVIDE